MILRHYEMADSPKVVREFHLVHFPRESNKALLQQPNHVWSTTTFYYTNGKQFTIHDTDYNYLALNENPVKPHSPSNSILGEPQYNSHTFWDQCQYFHWIMRPPHFIGVLSGPKYAHMILLFQYGVKITFFEHSSNILSIWYLVVKMKIWLQSKVKFSTVELTSKL